MAPQTLLDIFNTHLSDRNSIFVFPSAVPAQFWARRLCELKQYPIALERFIAWDEFKEQCLSVHQSERRPANGLSRILFASFVLEANAREAKSGSPLFTELLPPSYASEYNPFINYISGILPSLKTIMEKSTVPSAEKDPYLQDLRTLFHRYSDFLSAHKLYEPDWVRSPFTDQGRRWILLFPDLADDWESYEAELQEQKSSVHIYTIQDIHIDEYTTADVSQSEHNEPLKTLNRSLLSFPSWREEIRYVANLLSYLVHNAILSIDDITLSIPNLEQYAEELRLECDLRSIPVSLRQGSAITDQSGGRLFSQLQTCYQSHWSYKSLKNLLTDRSLPWKDPDLIQQFLQFGLEYRCLSGYSEGGKEVDVWLDTFSHILDKKIGTPYPVYNLKQFYKQLKRDITDIVTAKSFDELRTKLILFAGNHLDRERMDPEADQVYARAMEELARLIATEQDLADCSTGKAFPLFLAHLKNTTYVHQSEIPGIAIYPYRVAAGIAPKLHIVMNATQDGISVMVDPAPFLREDRKRSLAFSSIDRSKAFIDAYGFSPVTIFTAPDRGFTGHTIPHQALTSKDRIRHLRGKEIPPLEDIYVMEETGSFIIENKRPFEVQHIAWGRSRQALRPYEKNKDFRKAPIDSEALRDALYKSLTTKKEPNHISPTDINQFITCPFQWLLTRGLKITEPQLEIETIGQKDIGILYHAILEAFFNSLKEKAGQRIRANEITSYKELIHNLIQEKILAQRNEEGAFQESVYEMLSERIQEHLFTYIDKEIPNLDACSVLGPEYPLRKQYPELGIYLAGTADLILMDTTGELIIVDYKTNNAPKKKDLVLDTNGMVSNVQMAAYITMAENQLKTTVGRASFYSIEQRSSIKVIDPAGPPKTNSVLPVIRADYEPVLTALNNTLTDMVQYLTTGQYPVAAPANRSVCTDCPIKAVCRINFSGGEKA